MQTLILEFTKRLIRRSKLLTKAAGTVYRWVSGPFAGSESYWVERYEKGGTSGPGSYNELAKFKAQVLNQFVREHRIQSVIEFGSGDGNQLKLAEYPQYLGLDVSPTAIARCRESFRGDPSKKFELLRDYQGEKAELSLSLDVIYHLVEDRVFDDHLQKLVDSATRFVAIYSTNRDSPDDAGLAHVRHRNFTDVIARRFPNVKLLRVEKQPRAYTGDIVSSSLADFYFFEKT